MRYLSKYISAALMLILAVACNTKEIDNPDNPDKPQISDNIKIAASIKQTRVSYSVDNNKLVPDWEKDDVIFGYYGTGDGRIVFTVTGVDETTGIASLAASGPDWEDFLAEYKTAGKDLKVGLIYTGTKETDKDILFENENAVSVAMTSQTGENIPACMHATSFVPDKDDEGQIIRFLFDNDCAIFEIESLTGIAEEAALAEDEESLALTSLTITNLIPTYEYTYASGALSGKSGTGDLESYTMTLPENTWQVDYEGNINRTDAKNLLIAVAPNSSKNDILITATATDGMNSREFSYLYYGNLDAGECYIIKKRDVVAKTEDGQYFTSVSAAFDHAEELSGRYTTAADNVVTLIKKEINGFGEQTSGEPHMSGSYDIDYNVTLDLNGCTLSLSGAEGFYVNYIDFNTPATFTITDSNGLNDAKYEGKIKSTSLNPIIINLSNVIINGGELYFTFSDESYYERYSMIENEGGTITINNHSFLQAEGDSEVNTEHFLIKNDSEGEVNINNGDLYSYDAVNTIYNLEGTVTMSGGELYSRNEDAILNGADGIVNIVDGDIDSGGYYSIENRGIVTISGGNIYKYEDDDQVPTNDHSTIYNTNQLIVSGGIISSSLNYAVYCNGGSIEMSDGEISCSHSFSGALVLNDAGNSSISGGTLTCSGKSTISITGTSTLDVSGGKIICTGQDSAIEIDARDPEKIKRPTLTVRWPGNDVKDQPSGVYKPFLYSPKRAPIYENSSHTDHFSTVYIKGGFLYTGTSVKYFYRSDNSNTALQATSGYCFYSNVSSLHTYASGVKASNTSLSSAITIDASTHGVPGVNTGLSFSNKISIVAK